MKQMKSMQRAKGQKGFTLIELVIVIVVLGILAASALPRFVNLSEEARQGSIEGLAGSLRSAAAMAHAKAIVSKQNSATGTITVENQTINLVNGYPSAGSVFDMLSDTSGYEVTVNGTAATANNGAQTPASCQVSYAEAEGGNPPIITLTTTDCS